MSRVWERPYECDTWKITSFFVGHSLIRRRPQWKATAVGYRNGESHARYVGIVSTSEVGHGATREEAVSDMRRIICRDAKAYREWLNVRQFGVREYKAEDVCPC